MSLSPPAYPSADVIAASRRRHYLFGYPISHSASPAFQNFVCQFLERKHAGSAAHVSNATEDEDASANGVPTYSLCETKTIDESHLYQLVRHDPHHGGSGVTMPLKVAVAMKLGAEHVLDELDSIGEATKTVNTIVMLPSRDGETSLSRRRTVGTNTDCLGIRHAVLRDIAVQNKLPAGSLIGSTAEQGPYVFPQDPSGKPYSAMIIGSGGTCRSAVWALHNLGLSPLYLMNRDEQETQDVVNHFTNLNIDLRPLHSVQAYDREEALRANGTIGELVCAVGAIPAFEPVTPGEKMVYTLAHRFFKTSYTAPKTAQQSARPSVPSTSADASTPFRTFALPVKRSFLDMCYKPRLTPLLQFAATQTTTWSPIGGVEAMVEQGLAQARMWVASSDILHGRLPITENPLACATKAGDEGPLGLECEEQARLMVQNMSDVVVPPANLSAPRLPLVLPSAAVRAASAGQAQSVH